MTSTGAFVYLPLTYTFSKSYDTLFASAIVSSLGENSSVLQETYIRK